MCSYMSGRDKGPALPQPHVHLLIMWRPLVKHEDLDEECQVDVMVDRTLPPCFEKALAKLEDGDQECQVAQT